MFGSLAVYLEDKIIFLLRYKTKDAQANGVWIALASENDGSLHSEFPNMQPVHIMGKNIKGWGLLSVEARDFEESALHACDLVLKRDPRIGRVPKRRPQR